MEIVNGSDAAHTSQLLFQAHDVDVRRRALQENVDSIPNENPGTGEYEHPDDNTDCGIGYLITTEYDRKTGQNSADLAEGIAQHVEECSADVQAFLAVSKEQPGAGQVRKQTNGGDYQHPARPHLRGIQKSVIRLIENIKRDQNEKDTVQQRNQDLDAVKPIRLPGSGPPRGESEGEKTQSERGDIRQHVARICKQGQRIRVECAEELDYQERRGDEQGGSQTAPGAPFAIMMILVSASVFSHITAIIMVGEGWYNTRFSRGQFREVCQ